LGSVYTVAAAASSSSVGGVGDSGGSGGGAFAPLVSLPLLLAGLLRHRIRKGKI
jgi:MprA protease rhombosortase-interaction domain-containing protein